MRLPSPTPVGLPSIEQLMATPERALLAVLDANLELAARLLMTEHVDLLPNGRRSRDPDYEPHTLDLLPEAEALVLGARRLRRRIADYCTAEDRLLRSAAPGDPQDATDDDIPF
jgi:hypothetical protein